MTQADAASHEVRVETIVKLRSAALGMYGLRVEAVERYPGHVDLLMKAGADWFNLLNGAADMLALADEAASQPREGWRMVPAEPTEAMYAAGYDATRLEDGTPQFADAGFCLGHSGNIYRAMLAAAPTDQVEQQQNVPATPGCVTAPLPRHAGQI